MQALLRPVATSLAVVTLAVLAACGGAPATGGSGPAADAPTYRVGDRWVYRGDDGFRVKAEWEERREVTAIAPEGIAVRITLKGAMNVARTELWSAPGQVKVGAVYDNLTRRFEVPLQRYDFPLVPGKSWNQWVKNYNEFTKETGDINRYVRVGGWDKVTTPGGSFDAVKMQVLMRLDDGTFWRWPTTCNYTVWYAPAVRGVVRAELDAQYAEKDGGLDGGAAVRTQHGVLELVSFTPGA
jgi:hypothetical protein